MHGPNADASATVLLHKYTFYYGAPVTPSYSDREQLSDILECDGANVCKPGLHLSYGQDVPLDGEWTDVYDAKNPITDVRMIDQVSDPNGLGTWPPRIYTPDLNKDGKDDLLYLQFSPTAYNYVTRLAGGSVGSPTISGIYNTGPNGIWDNRLFPVALLGKGYPTELFQTTGGNNVSTGNAYLYSLTNGQFVSYGNVDLSRTTAGEMADLNGDGLPDLVETTQSLIDNNSWRTNFGWDYRLGNGNNLVTGGPLPTGPNDHRLVDIDGDGAAEILTVLDMNDSTRYSALSVLHPPANWNAQFPPTTLNTKGSDGSARPYVYADINGDGLTDAVELGDSAGDGSVYIWLNSGNGFNKPLVYASTPQYALGDAFVARTIDFNNDGRQDIVFRQVACDLNCGNLPLLALWFDGFHFNLTTLPTIASNVASGSKSEADMFEVLDFNGDGLDDIVMVNYPNPMQNTNGELHLYTRTNSAHRNRELVKIDRTGVTRSGQSIPGVEFDITYKSIADPSVYTDLNGEPCDKTFPSACVDGKLYVVSEITRSDDLTHQYGATDTRYTYSAGLRDLRGRGFLGFRNVSTNRVDKNITTTTVYNLDQQENIQSFYPFAGIPQDIYTYTSYSAYLVGTVQWTRSQAHTLTTVHTPTATGTSFFVYPSASTETVSDTYNGTLYQNTGTMTVDSNGTQTLASTTHDNGTDSVQHTPAYVDTVPSTWPRIQSDKVLETSSTSSDSLTRTRTLTYDSHWNLANVAVLDPSNHELDRGEQSLNITITPTAEGLPHNVTSSEVAPRTGIRQLTIDYDSYEHAFPSIFTDSLGHTKRFAYHPGFGIIAISEDESGLQSVNKYDGFGRTMLQQLPTGEETDYSYVSSPQGDLYPPVGSDTLVRVLISQQDVAHRNPGPVTVVESNFTGKPTVRRTWARPDGKAVYESFSYDWDDRLSAYYVPSFTLAGPTALVRAYDSLDRVTQENRPDGSVWNYGYNGLQTTVYDDTDPPMGTITVDSLGRITKHHEEYFRAPILHQITTRYSYGPFNTLSQITDSSGNATNRKTDRLGKVWDLQDPNVARNMGHRTYAMNAFGDLETETTPEYTTTRLYDSVGRLWKETTGSRINTLTYTAAGNGIGKLAHVDSPDGVATDYSYDTNGHLTSEQWTISGEHFTISNSYDAAGRLATVTYPAAAELGQGAFAVQYNYSAGFGVLQSITNQQTGAPFWQWQDADASGAFTTDLFGDGTISARSESSTNPTTLGRIAVTKNGTTLRDVSYAVNGLLDITSRTDNLSPKSLFEQFSYDPLHRLQTWTWNQAGTVTQKVQYAYDDVRGNMKSRTVSVGNGSNLTFTYDTSVFGPDQPVSSTLGSYVYDLNGRQTAAPGRTVSYTEFDLPSTVTANSETYRFSYDGQQRRVVKQRSNGDTTITLRDLYERKTEAGISTHFFSVIGAAGPIAVVSSSNGAAAPHYLISDHLDSTDLIVDDSGVTKLAYDPFGARIQPAPPEVYASEPVSRIDIGFTGQRHDDETSLGLINFNGRVYDPTEMRFVSADPILSGSGSQALSRYSYVRNNPVSRIDPTGFQEADSSSAESDSDRPLTGKCDSSGCQLPAVEVTGHSPRNAGKPPGPVGQSQTGTGGPPSSSPPQNYDGRGAAAIATGQLRPLWTPGGNCGPGLPCWHMGPDRVNYAVGPYFGQMAEHNKRGDAKAIGGFALFAVVFPFVAGNVTAWAVGAGTATESPGAITATRVVASRVNIPTDVWIHVINRHILGVLGAASRFLIPGSVVYRALSSPEVVNSPIVRAALSGDEVAFIREVEMGFEIGFDIYANGLTSIMTVMTDRLGNLLTAFPGTLR